MRAAPEPNGPGPDRLFMPTGLAIDATENLYVADHYNHRVLYFPSSSTSATRVYGQPTLVQNVPNQDGQGERRGRL